LLIQWCRGVTDFSAVPHARTYRNATEEARKK